MFVPLLLLLLLSSVHSATAIGCLSHEEGKEFQLNGFIIRCTFNGKGGIEAKTVKCIDVQSNLTVDVGESKTIDGMIYSCEEQDGNVKFNRIGPSEA